MAHDLYSLITVVDGVLKGEWVVLDHHKKSNLESLLEKVTSLKDLLEKSHHLRGKAINCLQSEIRYAAHKAEDIIESRAVYHQMMFEPEDYQSVTKVMEKLQAANDKLKKVTEHYHDKEDRRTTNATIVNQTSSKANDNMMVGFVEDALRLKHRLTSQRGAREIIPIIGMGGIGKTTLARNLYNDPLVVSHFDKHRAWVTVSQDYNMRSILLGLLGSIFGSISDKMLQENDNNLGDTLYRRLCGRRYLVVLDDIWSEKAWDEVKRFFPNEDQRSRVLITSRELHVATYPDPACEVHGVRLLSDAQGWDLLRHKVFEDDEHCPPFLEEMGQTIASGCGGLPLAISVIGGILSADRYSSSLWERVAGDVRSIVSHADNRTSKILSLSYDNLPLHLKPCFLYMSAFPEDYEVRRSRLVELFVAEGFVLAGSNGKTNSLEDTAEEYLKALVDRNLISVASRRYDGRAKSYRMHDLLSDLCVTKAYDEKFLRIFEYENVSSFRRVSIHRFTPTYPQHDPTGDLSCCRSLLFFKPKNDEIDISRKFPALQLVRVLDAYDKYSKAFPVELLKLTNLRYLAVTFRGCLPSAIWRLRNLQTIRLEMIDLRSVTLPYEAWEILCLRHIVLLNSFMCIDFKTPRIHENLQTICSVGLHSLLASNLINSIPNIKKLGIDCFMFITEDRRTIDLSHLHKLESLKLENFNVATLSLLKLPDCLKKLSLRCGIVPMGFVDVISDLRHLEAIKLKSCWFGSEEHGVGKEWELTEGVEFCSLQFLSLQDLGVARWKADYSNFPRLRHLRIRDWERLEEIPACIGEISTLETIEVDEGNPSHVDWADAVRTTQQDEYGNEIAVRIRESYK